VLIECRLVDVGAKGPAHLALAIGLDLEAAQEAEAVAQLVKHHALEVVPVPRVAVGAHVPIAERAVHLGRDLAALILVAAADRLVECRRICHPARRDERRAGVAEDA
jgi:hypothetical protein